MNKKAVTLKRCLSLSGVSHSSRDTAEHVKTVIDMVPALDRHQRGFSRFTKWVITCHHWFGDTQDEPGRPFQLIEICLGTVSNILSTLWGMFLQESPTHHGHTSSGMPNHRCVFNQSGSHLHISNSVLSDSSEFYVDQHM